MWRQCLSLLSARNNYESTESNSKELEGFSKFFEHAFVLSRLFALSHVTHQSYVSFGRSRREEARAAPLLHLTPATVLTVIAIVPRLSRLVVRAVPLHEAIELPRGHRCFVFRNINALGRL